MKKLDLPNIYFEKNIDEAIRECEQGHFLASVLISGRIIRYILDQIPGKDIEDKIETLREKGVINKERKDIRESVIKAARMARDFSVHNIEIMPQSPDALSLLGDAVNILKLYIQFYKTSQSNLS